MSTLRPVVLCGGSGTRLWPLSRSLYPKQFMELGGHTLFGDTVTRAANLPDSAAPLVVCNEGHRFYVAAALQQMGIVGSIPEDANLLVEATNNGNDPEPVWQDVTDEVLTETNIVFENHNNTAGAAFNFRITVERGESDEAGYITSVSGAFE